MIVPDQYPTPPGGGGIEWITPIINNGPGKMGLLWMLINFVVLLFILEKLLFKPLRNRTAAKHDAIKAELDRAQTARKEAETLIAEYKARLERLQAEIDELTEDAKERAESDRKRIVAAAQEEAARIEAAAKAGAEREADARRRQIEAEVVERAIARAEELLRKGIGGEDHRRMTDEYVDKLARVQLGEQPRAGGGGPA
jgi:F-type H+-transporting ATPase subunit b